MTAQVGILNSEVAVLASDTSSTTLSGRSTKIFKSIKKIHKLSDQIPVAFMIYGNSRFSDVLWSRVIDLFRNHLANEGKAHLKEYLEHFISFIENNSELTNYERNLNFFTIWARANYTNLENMVLKDGRLNESKFKSWIDERVRKISNNPDTILDKSKYQIIQNSFYSYLSNIMSINYVRCPILIKKFKSEIVSYFTNIFLRDLLPSTKSGIVTAGFGNDDIFPSLAYCEIEGLFENKVRMSDVKHYQIGQSNVDKDKSTARILPFAQSEGANLIMEGAAPEIKHYIFERVNDDTGELFSFLQNHKLFNGLEKEKRQKILNDIQLFSDRQTQELKKDVAGYMYKNYTNPIASSVNSMSGEDVARLAKALVNLTSLKRKYSINQEETVGGEIDVVLLNKESGYVEISKSQ
jgi:hypothetical protein